MDKDTLYKWQRNMPVGWSKAFGTKICDEIWDVLVKYNVQEQYYVLQVKERYGELCWYYGGISGSACDEVDDIIEKYEVISARTCVGCGKPATKLSIGWILPHCDRCARRLPRIRFMDIPSNY